MLLSFRMIDIQGGYFYDIMNNKVIAIGDFCAIENTPHIENVKFRILYTNVLVRMGAFDDSIRSLKDTPSPQNYNVDDIGLDLTKNWPKVSRGMQKATNSPSKNIKRRKMYIGNDYLRGGLESESLCDVSHMKLCEW